MVCFWVPCWSAMSAVMASDATPLSRTPRRRTDLKHIPRRASLTYTERFSKERLDNFRLLGDPLADDVCTELHAKHGGLKNIHDLLATVRSKAENVAGEEGNIFRNFLARTRGIPSWADRAMIERGQHVHAVHLPFMGLSLFAGSLVGGAQFLTAATVTTLAGNITTNPTRRIDETGMLLAALAFPGSLFEAGSEAHDSLTRVRLLHGALRHWLPRSGRLEPLKKIVPKRIYVQGEVPINQQDLAITLAVFCYINLRSLRRMSIVLSSWDIKCYVHMWRYAGYVLGIVDDLLPETLEDQEEFMLCSMIHQGVPDEVEAKPVKDFISAFSKAGSKGSRGLLPQSMLQVFLEQMTRHMNGMDYISTWGIEDCGERHWAVLLIRSLGWCIGTVLPRLPYMESALARLHAGRLRTKLRRRGTPTGHGAGTGEGVDEEDGESKQQPLNFGQPSRSRL